MHTRDHLHLVEELPSLLATELDERFEQMDAALWQIEA